MSSGLSTDLWADLIIAIAGLQWRHSVLPAWDEFKRLAIFSATLSCSLSASAGLQSPCFSVSISLFLSLFLCRRLCPLLHSPSEEHLSFPYRPYHLG